MSSAATSADIALQGNRTTAKSRTALISRTMVLLLLFLPAIGCALLVARNAVDTLHYDDFTFAEDWLKFKTGELKWGDLWTVHLEHRVTVPRLLALGAHLLGGSDVRWQNGLTLLLLLGTFANVLALWRRTTDTSVRAGVVPLLLMSGTIFCAVQWQPLLWPILFEIFVGTFSLSLALRLWAGTMNPWLAFVFSVLLCDAALFSFANGPLAWLVLPIAIWFQRPALAARTRWQLLGAWLACAVATGFLYFQNFHNSAPKQFAYNFGQEMTAADTIGSSLRRLAEPGAVGKITDFFFAVMGSHLSRGLHLHNLSAARWIGATSFALFVLILATLIFRRRQSGLLCAAAPWVVLGLFSAGSAAAITIGRVWNTRSGTVALLPRYVSHAVPLTVALIALVWILLRDRARSNPALRSAGLVAAGLFLGLLGMQWSYGAQQMETWRNARLQGKAMLMFSAVMPTKSFLGPVSGDGKYGADVTMALDRAGQPPVPLLKTLRLDQFHRSNLTLRDRQAGFNELHDTKGGGLFAIGFAELPDQRAADLVLFTTPAADGTEMIFGLGSALRLPNKLSAMTQKDDDGCFMDVIGPQLYAKWQGEVVLASKPPRDAKITAWALDVIRGIVYRIPDNRTSTEPLPPLPTKAQDDE